jgi:hypothetical protein
MKPITLIAFMVGILTAAHPGVARLLDEDHDVSPRQESSYLRGSLAKDEPQPVYSSDPNDAWNRIFHALFTRSVNTRVSDDFADAGPFAPLFDLFDKGAKLKVSSRPLTRVESGDRAIEPLYPILPGVPSPGVTEILTEPRFSQLRHALADALKDDTQRTPLARALMQSDAWAAYDVLSKDGLADRKKDQQQRGQTLIGLLGQFIRKIALTQAEIKGLPNNYAAAVGTHHLPSLFDPASGWMEVEWLEGRRHDVVTDLRRVTRIFVKPTSPPADRQAFVNRLLPVTGDHDRIALLDSVALVMQLLLVDTRGEVVPTPLTYEIQIRSFPKKGGQPPKGKLAVYELSRRLLLSGSNVGGFQVFDEDYPAYLPFAMNDYGFASRASLSREPARWSEGYFGPVVVSQRRHCAGCHGQDLTGLLSFPCLQEYGSAPRAVKILDPAANDRARRIAKEKGESASFKKLLEHWRSVQR